MKISSYQILHDKHLEKYDSFFDKILSDLIRQKFLKYGMFFTLKTIQGCSQAVAEKLEHAKLKCQSNKEEKKSYTVF